MEGKFIKGTSVSKRKHHIVKSECLNESNEKHSKGHHQKPGGSRDNIKNDRHGEGKTGSDISKENDHKVQNSGILLRDQSYESVKQEGLR